MPSERIITLDKVSIRYGEEWILRDVDFSVNKGDFLAVSGPNGGGKTTLLRVLLKLLKPTIGKVHYYHNGTQVSALPIGYLPQKNGIDLKFPITVAQAVKSGLLEGWGFKRPKDQDERLARVSEMLGLNDFLQQSIGTLSGGQLQRTLLARALISEPEVVVLDEPLSYVDKHFEQQIYSLVADLAKNTTIILVSHEMTVISEMANRHIIVDRGIHPCHHHHHDHNC
jgi:zinc transport system ATP-binding protein